MKPITYKDAGVDVDAGDLLVERIKRMVKNRPDPRVCAGVGGFAALYEISPGRYLASGTDGVGTKLELAKDLNIHNTIGIDLVAMCANDVLCTGARPLFFLDYFAAGKLDVDVASDVIEGIVEGCHQAGCALIGGETAEMPGMYQIGTYDLAGFAVGEVSKEELIDGRTITPGDTLVGIGSSGFHSNGYSLIRKLVSENERGLKKDLLTPTKIYVKTIQRLRDEKLVLKGLAHITGGGTSNISRMNPAFDYSITSWPHDEELPKVISLIANRSKLSRPELHEIFNMGIGMVIATSEPARVKECLLDMGEKAWAIGTVKKLEH